MAVVEIILKLINEKTDLLWDCRKMQDFKKGKLLRASFNEKLETGFEHRVWTEMIAEWQIIAQERVN